MDKNEQQRKRDGDGGLGSNRYQDCRPIVRLHPAEQRGLLTHQERRQRARRDAEPARGENLQGGSPMAVRHAIQRHQQEHTDYGRRDEVQQDRVPIVGSTEYWPTEYS